MTALARNAESVAGIRFRLADGSIVGNAFCERLEIYPVRLRDGLVEVALPIL